MFSFTSFCSISSLCLGVAAWYCSAAALSRARKNAPWQSMTALGLGLAAVSLQMQLECAANWARGEDVIALLDCCGAQAFAGRVLLAVTVGLNLLAFAASWQQRQK